MKPVKSASRIRVINALLMLCMALMAVRLGTFTSLAQTSSSFWVEYIDVGQGDAALVQCDGHYMLIDGGPSDASSVLYTILKQKGITSLDVVIATHPDADHIGGISGALNYASTNTCYSPVTEYDTRQFRSLVRYLKRHNISITVPKAGQSFDLGTAKVDLIGPISISDDSNNSSIVTKVTYGDTVFLFMGDAEEDEEKAISRAGYSVDCDVLKVAHHGSAYSTKKAFLRKASPRIAVISCGKDNSYGHPTKEVLDRLSAAKVDLYRTDLHGDITVSSDGKSVAVSTEKTGDKDKLWSPGSEVSSGDSDIIIPIVTTDTTSGGDIDRSGNTNMNTTAPAPVTSSYVLNTNTKKFHIPTCSSVGRMSSKNRQDVTMTRDEIIAMGYDPCGNCHP